jgi:hypothetical protein
MGCYDSVWFKCPNCGEKLEAQSKGGNCDMEDYTPNKVPISVALDLILWDRCKCGKAYTIKEIEPEFVKVELVEVDKTRGEEIKERWETQPQRSES